MTPPPPLRRRLLCCVALLGAAAAVRLGAQDPADRAALERLRDSLAAVTDSAALHRLEAGVIEIAKRTRDDPLIHLRLGFIAYRLGELADSKSHYDDAAGEFEWAGELKPGWPYPWYGLGLAELAQGEHSVIAIENLRQQLGTDYLTKAARAFARATQADPSFAQASIDLANAALQQRIQPRLQVALEAVRLAAASPAGRNPAVQLARGRIEREVGEADSALAAFHGYLAVGGDSGVGLIELARTAYFARRPAEGRTAYFAGAQAAASAAALGLYRTELGFVATVGELATFDALTTPAARAAWLEHFWLRRDVVEAREPGERLAEHYRRWFYARHSFRLVSRHRHYDITERYRTAQTEFDDRGIIYIRHGEPDRRAQYSSAGTVSGSGLEPNESWLYRRSDGNLIFHFVSRGDVQDFKLVESALDALGFRARFDPTQGGGATGRLGGVAEELWDSRAALDPMYQRPPSGMRLNDERAQGDHAIKVGTTTDSYRHRFDVPLDLVASDFVVGARGDSGGAAGGGPGQVLHVVFAVPAERLTPQTVPAGVRYALRFRLLVTDTSDSLIGRIDTVRVFAAPAPLRSPAYLAGRLEVPVPAGSYRYRLLVATADNFSGEVMERDSLDVETLDGHRFAASDLVLGRVGAGLVWPVEEVAREGGGSARRTAPVDTVVLNPLGRFPQGSAVELYYEVYGLDRATTYHTVVRLDPVGGRSLLGALRGLFGGRRPPVLLEFDAPADGPITRVHRSVELRDLAKGDYILSVVVTDPAGGRTLTRARRFQVVSRP
jgi:GWxTD domain-containing protein